MGNRKCFLVAIALLLLAATGAKSWALGTRGRTADTSGPVAAASATATQEKGTEGAHATFDAVVGLLNERGFACSGVLIHPKAVLTARHCRGMKQVVFGADATKPVARRKIVREAVAPNPAIDMAVLVLADNAPVAPYGLTLSAHPPRQLHVVGYGCTSQDCSNGAGRRSHFSFDYRDLNWGCDRIAAAQTGCIQGFELVLSGSRQADTCVGDSGGPVLERWGDQWRVVAITSRAVADSVLPCGDGGIYVRVEPQQGWLRKVIGKL